MATICKYCNEAENKQDRPGLICESCICFIHLGCLCRLGTPGNLACDVFFDFTCLDCSPEKKEVLKRNKFPWVNVIYLTLHHLSIHSYGIGNHGFFHYKTHICSFIDRNWGILFGPQFKQKKNWVGTIAGALSVHNNVLFRSGSIALGESGWWKLQHGFSPAVAAHILQELAREKPKGRVRNQLAMDKHSFIRRVTELGYKDLLGDDSENVPIAGLEPSAKKRRFDVDAVSGISGAPYLDYVVDIKSEPAAEEAAGGDAGSLALQLGPACGDLEAAFRGFDFPTTSQDLPPPSDSSSPSHQHSTANFDSDSRSRSPPAEPHAEPPERQADLRRARKEDKPVAVRETLFSRQLNSVDMPWVTKKEEDTEKRKTGKELVEMSQYEEVQLLKRVQQLTSRVRNPNRKAELRRFRAKLALRRLKRHKHVPLFDLDRAVKLLGGYISEGPKAVVDSERVLDRFQRSYLMDSLSGTVSQSRSGPVLLSRCEARPTQSPHSGCLLKPYVRRDLSSRPLWLALTEELLAKANRKNPKFVAPPRGSIDYSYVRPQHIAAVNSLCAQHFWPGIDVSEALQYPEFSCVVTYKKIVIGFAFLVPDVAHNQAYISFLLTRPEWRRAGIATFMLYHLLQTCTGKDVTLHVSPTNSAIFLYQRFGFKVEEFIQDFYEKYYDIDYKGCRHALLLRLAR